MANHFSILALERDPSSLVIEFLFHHFLDFPLRSATQSLVCDVDEFSQIAREVERGKASVRENVSCIFVGNTIV